MTSAMELPAAVSAPLGLVESADLPAADDCTGLVRAARAGDRTAFAELYRRYTRMVHGLILARVPYADADDLVQEVFLTALRRLGALRNPAAFPGWLAAIARNRATDHLRRLPRDAPLDEADGVIDEDRSTALAVLAEIRRLPEPYREPLVLRLVEGMTGPEIAARTGLTHGSVRVNLHRGMKLLRAALKGGPRRV
jgi:RNA polymerase sigma-70 factor (ECF subfamily)